jgi:Bax protein
MWILIRRFIVSVAFLVCLGVASFATYHHLYDREEEPLWDLQGSQVDFIHFILERANISNEAIINQRRHLLLLYQDFHGQKRIPLRQRHWLSNLADTYKEFDDDFTKEETWQRLISKVDVVPNSLVIAQAIEESGWG